MKRFILFCLSILGVFTSCSLYDEQPGIETSTPDAFYASFGDNEMSRTSLGDNGRVLWNPGDNITVFADGQFIGTFRASCASPSPSTGFFSISYGDNRYKQTEIPERADFIAIYPSIGTDEFDLNGSSFTIVYPAVCTATTAFPSTNFYSVAKSEDQNLTFYHISGALKFTVTHEDIDTLFIRTKHVEDVIAGTARVKLNENNIPEIVSMSKCSQTLKVLPPEGSFFKTNTDYFVTLPPGTYSNGLYFDLDTPYSTASRNIVKDVKINRSEISLLTEVNKGLSFDQKDNNDAYYSQVYDVFNLNGGSVGIYCPYRFAFNLCGDDIYSGGGDALDFADFAALNEFTLDASSVVLTNAYQNFLKALHAANVFLSFQYGDSEKLNTQISEIRVLRAFCQMMLTIGWHNPPLYSSNKPDLPNSSYLDNLDWCAQECIEAAEYLPERLSTQDKEGAYKVTKGFALAVAGKALLFAEDYVSAKKCFKDIIDSEKYDLVPGNRYWENFHIEGDGNEEKIYEANIEYNEPYSYNVWSGNPPFILRTTWMEANVWNWRTDHFQKIPAIESFITNSGGGWGGCGVAEEFANEFLENDGHSARLNATIKHIDDVIYGLEYNDNNIDNMTLENKKSSKLIGLKEPLYGQSFFLAYKPIIRESDSSPALGSNVRLNNFTFMRYAEVLLMYAECCIQTGDISEAKKYINLIQDRAGSRTVSETVDMNVLKAEKKYELWLEGCRWADLARWGDTNGVKESGTKVPTLHDKLFSTPPNDGSAVWENSSETDSRFYITYINKASYTGKNVGFKAGKHEYFPFPSDIIKDNPNITQNPGW